MRYRDKNPDYIAEFNKLVNEKIKTEKDLIKQKIEFADSKISLLSEQLKTLYIEKNQGIISLEIFSTLAEQFNFELQEFRTNRQEFTRQENELAADWDDAKNFLKTFENLSEISCDDLSESFLSLLISRIEVDERKRKRTSKPPKFKIIFHGIGEVDFI